MDALKSLIPKYAKMFAGGAAAALAQGINKILAYVPAEPPLQVGDDFIVWLTAALVAVAVGLVPNSQTQTVQTEAKRLLLRSLKEVERSKGKRA